MAATDSESSPLSLPTEAEYARMGAHLETVRPVFEAFCRAEGYETVFAGRYPRIRVEKAGDLMLFIDLWMTYDEKGGYRRSFSSDTPYQLNAGAYFLTLAGEVVLQYYKILTIWPPQPFSNIDPLNLAETLRDAARTLSSWSRTDLVREGTYVECAYSGEATTLSAGNDGRE